MKLVKLLSIPVLIIAVIAGCGKRSIPPEESLRVQLIEPADNEVVEDIGNGFDWESYPGAEEYVVRILSDTDTIEFSTTSSNLDPDFELANGEYKWSVAVVENGDYVHWSDKRTFFLSQVVIQTVPDEFATLNGTRVFFDWYNYPNANGYHIKIWPAESPDEPVFDGYEFSSSINPGAPFFEGDYCWCVGAKSADEEYYSHWSDTLCFVVDQYPYELADTMHTRGYPRDIYPYGEYLYVADGSAGLLYCDRSDPLNPVQIGWDEPSGQYENRAIWIDEQTDLMIVADYRGNPPILWFDITNRTSPTQVNWAGLFARRTQDVAGVRYRDTLFVAFADYDDGGFVFDLHDTTDYFVTPRGSIDPNGFTFGVAFCENLFFVAAGQVGVFIAATANADSIIGHVDTPGEADKIAIDGHYCYIADGLAGLTVIDFTDPTNPIIVGRADTQTGSAQDVKISGDRCFVAYGSGGTIIYDISDPTNPIPIQNIDGTYSFAITVDGDELYIADRDWGIVTLSR